LGHKFSLILSREITDEESVTLKEAGGGSAVFLTDTLPTNASVTVTRIDYDDSLTPTLAESIEAALEAAKKVPDLTVPGLSVPAVPKEAAPQDSEAQTVQGATAAEEPAAATTAKRGKKKAASVAEPV
jgi:hypothetical protein